MSRFSFMTLDNMWGFGFDIARDDYWEYQWWEFELHLQFYKYLMTVRINRHVI